MAYKTPFQYRMVFNSGNRYISLDDLLLFVARHQKNHLLDGGKLDDQLMLFLSQLETHLLTGKDTPEPR
jgi:hypothetical protein